MPHFSNKSLAKLNTCAEPLQKLMQEAIKIVDFTVTCGHREEAEQNQAYAEGTSKVQWPDSLHNKVPSQAVDIVPWPIEWPDAENDSKQEYARKLGRFYHLAGIVKALAMQFDIGIRWGGDWGWDFPHFELINKGKET